MSDQTPPDSRYGWVITRDYIDEDRAVGVMGPRGCTFAKEDIAANGVQFRMYDDDNELYYEGYLIGGEGFEPLDDYGTPSAGCTYIQYKEKGKWVTL